MDAPKYEQLTVGILIKREAGVFGPRGIGLFYDATQKSEPYQMQSAAVEYTEETIYGKLSHIGGKHKYPNVDPATTADLYCRTLLLAGIDAEKPEEIPLRLGLEGKRGHVVRFPVDELERGRSIFEFLSTMYYDHRRILTSFVYIDRMRKQNAGDAAVVTIGPAVRVQHLERFQSIYTGHTEAVDSTTVDKGSVALEFYSVNRDQLQRCVGDIEAARTHTCIPLEGLSAHQVAYTHSVMWDSKDLPRGYRANFVRRGLGSFATAGIGNMVAYSLFPAEMKPRLLDSLQLLQKISLGPPELLQEYQSVNRRIREVAPDEIFADVSFRE